MPSFETLMLFTATAFAITLVPGPSMLYVATRSISQGRRAGVYSALGLATGLFMHTLCASLGLSTVFIYFPIAFLFIKYLGAVYLVYLGIQMFLLKKSIIETTGDSMQPCGLKVYRQGVITEILNPKTALFFLSFLPQFVDPLQGSSAIQMLVLGSVLIFIAFAMDLFIAVTGGALSKWMLNRPVIEKIQNRIAGTVLISLGIRLAFSERE